MRVLRRPGRAALLGALAFFGLGRTFGLVELYVVGAALVTLVAVALVRVLRARVCLEIGRSCSPTRIHAGGHTRVDLVVVNRGRISTPVLALHEPVTGTAGADVLVPAVPARSTERCAYRLATQRRGLIGVGPLEVVLTEPFGLAATRTTSAPRVELTVLPRIDDVAPPPLSPGRDPLAGRRVTARASSAGDEFRALRDYVIGDDLRRVHWAASARHQDLLVREDEIHWQARTTLVLDTRVPGSDPDAFETAVSAAASLLVASGKRGDLLRLVTTAGYDSGIGAGTRHIEQLLEVLATVEQSAQGELLPVLEGLAQRGGAAVVLVGHLDGAEQAAVLRQAATMRGMVIVATDPRQGATTHGQLLVLGTTPFASAWNRTVGRRPASTGAQLGRGSTGAARKA